MVQDNPNAVKRFMVEARTLKKLKHQGLVKIVDMQQEPLSYFTMEYVEGTPLDALVSQGASLPVLKALEIIHQVALVLSYIHEKGMIHRDIKPSNIMITREGDVKLMDFGIAKDTTVTDLTQQGMLVGSPPYVAPELLSGKGATAATDIWALGVTMFELLAGDRPFKGAQTAELFHNIAKGKREKLTKAAPGVARPLASIVEKCLQLKPEKRFKDAGELSRALQTCVRWMAPELDLSHRLIALMVNRGEMAVQAVTVMDEAVLEHTRQLDTATRHWQKPRRWPYVLVAVGSALAGTAYASIKGIIHLPAWPF
jgi:serine/threonine-protein kinase